jgi:hypothetical protein
MCRRLDEWLITGKGKSALLTKLISVGSLQEAQVTTALKETSIIFEAEKRALRQKSFKPHIYIETERSVTSFCIGLLAARFKYIYDKELSSAVSNKKALKVARQTCKNHFLQNNGQCQYFGKITGYKICAELTSSISVTISDCFGNKRTE